MNHNCNCMSCERMFCKAVLTAGNSSNVKPYFIATETLPSKSSRIINDSDLTIAIP